MTFVCLSVCLSVCLCFQCSRSCLFLCLGFVEILIDHFFTNKEVNSITIPSDSDWNTANFVCIVHIVSCVCECLFFCCFFLLLCFYRLTNKRCVFFLSCTKNGLVYDFVPSITITLNVHLTLNVRLTWNE